MTNDKMPLSLGSHTDKNRRLRSLFENPGLIIAPGVFDCLTVRLAEKSGCAAAYMTGSGVSITRLGAPDIALLSFAEILDQAKRMADITTMPIIADADTGYGNAVNVRRTVEEFEAAGVAAIHIEDQVSPKRCGQLPGARPVIDMQEAVGKIAAAVAARRDPDFVIIARTDAAGSLG